MGWSIRTSAGGQTVTPANNSVDVNKLVDGAVTTAKISSLPFCKAVFAASTMGSTGQDPYTGNASAAGSFTNFQSMAASAASGKISCPVAGIYKCTVSWFCSTADGTGSLRRVGAKAVGSGGALKAIGYSSMSPSAQTFGVQATVAERMEVGDYFNAAFSWNGVSLDVDPSSFENSFMLVEWIGP